MLEDKILKSEEKAVFALRSLYQNYGYLPYKMSKFEEYELYMRNKDFLVSDRIITFNDTNGKLLALKPDVTLSIVKNGEDISGVKQKVCYNENVYRVSDITHQYKEIMQTGLECIGEIDFYDIYEVISLAAQSLAQISEKFILEISHLGLLSVVIEQACTDGAFIKEAFRYIEKKNTHDLKNLCRQYEVDEAQEKKLEMFVTAYGDRKKVIAALEEVLEEDELKELKKLSELLELSPYSEKIRFDFSVVNDRNYYNGFVFRGFLDGICDSVLAGGQYDKLMQKMGRSAGAVGFAVYLDLLEQLQENQKEYDVDVLLLYDTDIEETELIKFVNKLTSEGKTVSAQKAETASIRYKEIIDLRREKLC